MHASSLVLVLLLARPVVAAADAQPAAAIPIVLQMDGRIAVAVRINGAGPYRFRLDTGASRTVVSARLATELGLAAAGRSRTITQTGEASRGLVRVAELGVGTGEEAQVADLLALVLPPAEIDPAGRVEGLLGIDVLSRWIYTIDYGASRLLLGPDAAAYGLGAVRMPLVRGAGGLVATVDLGGAGGTLDLVPDSGADRLVLFGPSIGALPPLTLLGTVRVRSILGDEPARLVRLDHLQVGGIPIGTREAVLLPDRPPGGVMGDGLLPLHLFGRATFDLAGSALWLEPRR